MRPTPRHVRARAVRLADLAMSARVGRAALYVAIAGWLVYRVLMSSFFARQIVEGGVVTEPYVLHRVYLLVILCELGRIWRSEYGRCDAVALAVLILMSVGASLHGDKTWICDAVLVFAARKEDLRRLLCLGTAVVAATCAVVVAGAALGTIPNVLFEQGTRLRYGLGFRYCLFPAQYLFTITCTLCYLRDRRMRWIELVALLLVNVVCYLLTDSRLSFGLGTLALLVTIARKLVRSDAPWGRVARLARWSFVAVTALGIVVIGVYALQDGLGIEWLDGIDKALGGRLGLTYRGLRDLGVHLFGSSVTWVGNGLGIYGGASTATYNYIDNAFFHALVQLGAVYAIGLTFLWTSATFRAERHGQHQLVVMLSLVALHLLIDDLALMLPYDTLLFAVSASVAPSATAKPREEA